MRCVKRVALAALMVTAAPSVAQDLSAVEPDLITDRPDFTESPVVVPLGRVQLEGGLTWLQGDGDVNAFSGPELLIRWTPAPRLELRFGLPDYAHFSSSYESGLTDSVLGCKVQLGPAGVWDLAFIAEVALPTGQTGITSDAYDPAVIFIVGRELSERWSFGAQIAGASITVDDERQRLWAATAVFGFSFTDEWGSFFELAAEMPEEGSSPAQFHTGLTRALGATAQIDLHAAFGLNDASPDWLVGAGFALRF